MQISKTQAEVTNVNPRKENGEDGNTLASDISLVFAVPRETLEPLFSNPKFLDQFFSDDGDTRMDCVFPIVYGKRIENLRAKVHVGLKPMVFEGAKIAANMKLTPQVGNYVKVEAKLQVYPTRDQSGRLDEAAREFIDIEVETLTRDLMDDADEAEAA